MLSIVPLALVLLELWGLPKSKVLPCRKEVPQQHPAEMRNPNLGVIQPHNLLLWSQTCCHFATRLIWRDAAPRHGPSLGCGDVLPMGTTPELATTAPRRPRPYPYKPGIASESPVGQVRCLLCLGHCPWHPPGPLHTN